MKTRLPICRQAKDLSRKRPSSKIVMHKERFYRATKHFVDWSGSGSQRPSCLSLVHIAIYSSMAEGLYDVLRAFKGVSNCCLHRFLNARGRRLLRSRMDRIIAIMEAHKNASEAAAAILREWPVPGSQMGLPGL